MRIGFGRPALGASALVLALVLGADGAEAGWREDLTQTAREWALQAERAVILGGVVLYQYRHTVAGAVLGCAAGATAGATAGAVAGVATGGAALPGTGPAAALGCGIGGAAGAQLGWSLDHAFDFE